MNKQKMILAVFSLLGIYSLIPCIMYAKSVDIYNYSNQKFYGHDIYVHTTIAWCNNIWIDDKQPLDHPNSHYSEGVNGTCCYDWFEVKGKRFYIPNQCRPAGPRIEIMQDGNVYIDGSKAGSYGDVGGFFKQVGNQMGDAFKSLGNDLNKGFTKLGACTQVATLGTELAAKVAAQQTVLSGNLTDAIVQAAQESAIQPLIGARKAAEQVLELAKQFLEKAGKPIATGSIEAARQTASGALQAGETASIAVLTATDQATQALLEGILKTFNIEQLRYEGSLQKLASGNLGNVQCKATIAKQKIDFNFDLTIKDPIKSIDKLATAIADKIVDLAQKTAQKAAGIFHTNITPLQDDVLKLTLWHCTKELMSLNLTINKENIV
jgi:hypothetical protein